MSPLKARSTLLASIPRSLASAPPCSSSLLSRRRSSGRPRCRLVQSYCKALLVFGRRFAQARKTPADHYDVVSNLGDVLVVRLALVAQAAGEHAGMGALLSIQENP